MYDMNIYEWVMIDKGRVKTFQSDQATRSSILNNESKKKKKKMNKKEMGYGNCQNGMG